MLTLSKLIGRPSMLLIPYVCILFLNGWLIDDIYGNRTNKSFSFKTVILWLVGYNRSKYFMCSSSFYLILYMLAKLNLTSWVFEYL